MNRIGVRSSWLKLCMGFCFLLALSTPAFANTPALIAPTPGSHIDDFSLTFSWSEGSTLVDQWWLYVGTSTGAFDVFDSTSSLGSDLSVVVDDIPLSGNNLYVRLWYRTMADGWLFIDYEYTTDLVAAIVPTSPPPNSVLNGETVAFSWSPGSFPVTAWWLQVGTSAGATDIHDSLNLGLSLSEQVNTLPADGSMIYVRLWYFLDDRWQYTDSVYLSDPAIPGPVMTAPVPGSVFTSTTQTFSWFDNGFPVDQWWLYVGSAEGGRDYLDSGNLFTNQTSTVTGLPTDGSIVYVRLWHREAGGDWEWRDFTYTALLEVTSLMPDFPVSDSKLSGSTETFSWSPAGFPVQEWWLEAGTGIGRSDYYNSGSLGTSLSTVVTGLPVNGSTVFVRFWYRVDGEWLYTDITYRAACLDSLPSMASPVGNSVLGGDTVTFNWTPNSSSSSEWWLYVGSSIGASDYVDTDFLDGLTSYEVSGLPTDGSDVYVRLWHREAGGSWQFLDYQYTAANN